MDLDLFGYEFEVEEAPLFFSMIATLFYWFLVVKDVAQWGTLIPWHWRIVHTVVILPGCYFAVKILLEKMD